VADIPGWQEAETAGKLNFNISLVWKNVQLLPEMEARLKNMQSVFEEIVADWAKGNEDKFANAAGMEAVGAQIDPGVFWEALSPEYSAWKRKEGMANQIMVATGALEAAMSDPSMFFHMEMPQEAAFGIPTSPEEEAKMGYNWYRRQTLFLSADDQIMIRHHIRNFLAFGEKWQEIMFTRGLERTYMRNQTAQMEADFGGTMAAGS
jgi:hypothetical protein